jgi:four helix bundle protein
MNKNSNSKPYDLADRTFLFARDVISLIKSLPRNISNIEVAKQLVRSAGSVGANYIEANESLSKKDFLMRIKICRKECKESSYWLRLIETKDDASGEVCSNLAGEATELMKIFNSIIEKGK